MKSKAGLIWFWRKQEPGCDCEPAVLVCGMTWLASSCPLLHPISSEILEHQTKETSSHTPAAGRPAPSRYTVELNQSHSC